MRKRFRLSTEVRATLQRKHDRWTPYRAYTKVEKEVDVFRAICQIILSFFLNAPKSRGRRGGLQWESSQDVLRSNKKIVQGRRFCLT